MAINWNKCLLGYEEMVDGVMILWIGSKLKYFLDYEEMVNGVKILMDWHTKLKYLSFPGKHRWFQKQKLKLILL